MKRTLLKIAVVALAAAALAACSKQQQASGSGGASTDGAAAAKTYANGAPASAADPIDPAKFPYSVAEPMTIEIYDVASNFQGVQPGWFGDVVKRRFNIDLSIIAPQTSGNGDQLYQTRSAAGYLGDIVLLDNSPFQDCIDAGLIEDMTDEIQNTTYLKQYLEQYKFYNSMLEGNSEGKIYGFPTEITNTSATKLTDNVVYIAPRVPWDYFSALGAPAMKTTDDLLTMLKTMMDTYPTNANGDKNYGVSLWPDWDGAYMEPAVQVMKWYGYASDPAYSSIQLDYKGAMTDLLDENGGYVQALRFFNKAHQMGVLDPDSATQTWEGGMVPKMTTKRIFLLWYSWQNGFWNTPARGAAGENFMYAPVDDMRFYQPGDTFYGSGRVFAVGANLDPAKKERVIALLDWLCSPECLTFQHSGLPNWSYDKNADGTFTLTDTGASALMDNLPVPADWGGKGYNDGMSKINQWMMNSVATNPATNEPYRPEYWSSYIKATQTKTNNEWSAKFGSKDEVEYMLNNGQMSVIPNVNLILPTDPTDISLIRGQCGTQVTDTSWKMIFASSDAEFASMLAKLKSDLAGLGWDKLVEADKAKAQLVVNARNAAAN